MKPDKLLGSVYVIKIELSSKCNSACLMCPRIIEKKEFRRNDHMKFDTFKKIIDELEEEIKKLEQEEKDVKLKNALEKIVPYNQILLNCFSVESMNSIKEGKLILRLHGFGESFLNPDFIKIIEYIKNKDFYTTISTNGSVFEKMFIKKLIKLDVIKEVIFSFDSHIPKQYNLIRKGLDYDKIISNIEKFREIINNIGSPCPKIRINIVKTKENSHNITESLDFFLSKGFVAGIDEDIMLREKIKFENDKIFCPIMQYSLFIHSNGDVVKCPLDSTGKLKIGNIKEKSLKEIWSSKKNKEYLEINQSGKLKNLDICRRYCIK